MIRESSRTSSAREKATPGDGPRRVIIRFADGSVRRGYFSDEESQDLRHNLSDHVSIQTTEGNHETVEVSSLKAIFFVKSFEGTRDYSEFKVFTHQPSGKGVWVRVHFEDGEVMEGIAPNSLSTFASRAFSLTPPDPRSNNETVIVSKSCLKEMQILGLASD